MSMNDHTDEPGAVNVDGVTFSDRQSFTNGFKLHKTSIGGRHTFVVTTPSGEHQMFPTYEGAYGYISRNGKGEPVEVEIVVEEHPLETPIRESVKDRYGHGRING